ncbi:General amino-acid permease GAP2 [Erysiphe neolycopersici]|uniref:General amino-acid permease GAP2 n=1 Tax=Erysiphe neolycopersici TaxID=212602 RepID=A0A420HW38_9PEZI|nr:General amino-acid permease GAP2 [Erysiphe neolycopersici]
MSLSSPDLEKRAISPSSDPSSDPYSELTSPKEKRQFLRNIIDSFKREPYAESNASFNTTSQSSGFNHVAAARKTANSGLAHQLKSRHMQMIAIGGCIGTGIFVTSGATLSTGGPASVVIAYSIMSILMFCTIQALGEMAALYPVAGSFSAYSTRFLDPAWGFAMGWNYAIQWLLILPLEIVAASITLSYWPTMEKLQGAFGVAIFLLIVISINLFSVRGYGESEFVFAIIKIVAVISFIILGIILNCGGGSDGDYIGGRYWVPNNVPPNYLGYVLGQEPGSIASGAFRAGFKGLCSVFVVAAFSFTGTELVGLAAAEAENPGKSLPTAIKQVFWRICIFYICSLTVVSLLVPYGDARLIGDSTDARTSPFVIAITNAGIEILPSLMNFVILIAVLSVGNSAIYGSSRTLAALAHQGQAPQFLSYIDRKGRPINAIGVSSAIGLLCFLVAGGPEMAGTALKWLYSVSGLSSILTWGSICLAHIRYRAAWKAQGRSIKELPFRSRVGIVGSWIGFSLNFMVLVAQFWVALWPIGYGTRPKFEILQGFLQAYFTVPFVFLFFISYKLYYKTSFMKINDMDLDTGRREMDANEINQQLFESLENLPRWKKVSRIFC